MSFVPSNGQNPMGDPDFQARLFNTVLEQLCVLRADVSALHGVVQHLGTKQGLTTDQMQALRLALREAAYQAVCADVLRMLRP